MKSKSVEENILETIKRAMSQGNNKIIIEWDKYGNLYYTTWNEHPDIEKLNLLISALTKLKSKGIK